jgi:hypothetical protein
MFSFLETVLDYGFQHLGIDTRNRPISSLTIQALKLLATPKFHVFLTYLLAEDY